MPPPPSPSPVHRMCIVSRAVLPRTQLWRIVRTPEGKVLLDLTGRASGRGMYVSKKREILEQLFLPKKRGLWKWALKCEVSAKERETVWEEIQRELENPSD